MKDENDSKKMESFHDYTSIWDNENSQCLALICLKCSLVNIVIT